MSTKLPTRITIAEAPDGLYVIAHWGRKISIYAQESERKFSKIPVASFKVKKYNKQFLLHLTDLIASGTIIVQSLRDAVVNEKKMMKMELKEPIYGYCAEKKEL